MQAITAGRGIVEVSADGGEVLCAQIVEAVSAVGSSLALLSTLCERAPHDVWEAVSDQIADAGLLSVSVEDSVLGFFRLAEQVRRVI